jgi:FtsH-binding integral membrane protein
MDLGWASSDWTSIQMSDGSFRQSRDRQNGDEPAGDSRLLGISESDMNPGLMSSYTNPYVVGMVSDSPEAARAEFIRETYFHLAGAIGLFVIIEALFIRMGLGVVALNLLGSGRYSWLIVLGAFMGVSWLADRWATNGSSRGMQYAGLALYTVAEAVIFLPMITVAMLMTGDGSLIMQAGLVTAAMVLGISAVAFTTKKDFSFLGGILKIGGFVALGLIVASFIFPISLGLWFSGLMVVFASGSILYNTSNLIHRYQPGQHVAAALSLFASVALLFWYVLRILMSMRRN